MNMKLQFRSIFVAIGSLALVLVGCSSGQPGRGDQHAYTTHTLLFDGRERTYLIITPEDELTEPLALILALHGGGGTARSMCAMPGGLTTPARDTGYLLVCPEGFDRHWNDGRDIQRWRAHAEGIDDVGFLMALIDHLSLQYPIDQEMIFASGISNGGQMSYRLACERSDRIMAIAPVVASMAVTLDCDPSNPVSILVINGTEDPLVPYEGGEIRALRRGLGYVHSTSEVIQFWARHNSCAGEAERYPEPDRSPADGTRIWRMEYDHCLNNTRVILYEVEGGGHTWPGANQYLPKFLIGRLSRDMQASEVIIDFFEDVNQPPES
jgi:polyhydroxybutyrate depolymerase